MGKFFKRLFWAVVAAAVLLVAVIGVLLIPAVQKSIVARLVDPGPEGEFSLDRIWINWGGAVAEGIQFRRPGMEIGLDSINLSLPLSGVIRERRADVRSLVLRGLVIDLTVPAPDTVERPPVEAEDIPSVFEGILTQISIPPTVSLQNLEIEGKVLLPHHEGVRTVRFELAGGGLGVGQKSEINWKAALAEAVGPDSFLDLDGYLSLAFETDGQLRSSALNARALLESGAIGLSESFSAQVLLDLAEDGETYRLSVLRHEETREERWVEVDAAWLAAEQSIRGDWNLRVPEGSADDILRALAANDAETPALAMDGSGRFALETNDGTVDLSGGFQAGISQLGRIASELEGLERMDLGTRFDMALSSRLLEVRDWNADLRGGEGIHLLEARLIRPFVFHFDGSAEDAPAPGEDLVSLRLAGIPLSLVEPWLGEGNGVTLKGEGLSGNLLLRAAEEGLALTTTEALRAGPLRLAVNGEPMLEDLRMETALEGFWHGEDFTVMVPVFALSDGRGELLRLRAAYSSDGNTRMELRADFSAWARQPLVADWEEFAQGSLQFETEGAMGEGGVFSASWNLRMEPSEETGKGTAAQGAGRVERMADGRTSLQGRLRSVLSGLSGFLPELAALEDVTLELDFDLSLDDEVLALESANLMLEDSTATRLLEIHNARPFRYGFAAGALLEMEGRNHLADIRLRGLPVELPGLFLAGESQLGRSPLRDGQISGHLAVWSGGESLSLEMTEPFRITPFDYVTEEGRQLIGVSLRLDASAIWKNNTLLGELSEAVVDGPHGEIARLNASLREGGAFSARGGIGLPALLRQPLVAGSDELASGRGAFSAEGRWGELSEIRAEASLSEMRLRKTGEGLPPVTVTLLARQESPTAWFLELPVSLDDPRAPSDLLLAGKLDIPDEGDMVFNLGLKGKRVMTPHLLELIDLLGGPEEDAAVSPAEPSDHRDSEPFWAGFRGKLDLDIERLVLDEGRAVERLEGEIVLEPDALVSSLRAVFLNSPLTLEGGIRFDPAREKPYQMEGLLDAPRLDAGAWFRSTDSARPPTVEGRFALQGSFHGGDINLERLMNGLSGEMQLNSDGGVYRLFLTENPLVRFGIAGAGALGLLSGQLGTVVEVAESLSNLRYDTMNLQVRRDEALNIVLEDFRVLSPDFHVRGSGGLAHREGVPLLLQAMNIELELGARGRIGNLLSSLRVLGDRQDDLGYRMMVRNFRIGGTPSSPDNADFYRFLVESAARMLLPRPGARESRPPETTPEAAPPPAETERPPEAGVAPLIDGLLDDLFGRGRRDRRGSPPESP